MYSTKHFALLLYSIVVLLGGFSSGGFSVSPLKCRTRFTPPLTANAPRPLDTSLPIAQRHSSLASAVFLSESDDDNTDPSPSLRTRLRNLTGFSFTALRATLRATTGISLTAVRRAVGAMTSKFVTKTMKTILGVFPPWFRYFFQPFLIMYYAPLMIMKSLVGPTRNFWKDERATHEAFVEGWRNAVEAAEQAQHGGYWPVHVNEETGAIEEVPSPNADEDEVDVVDAVYESVEVAMSEEEEAKK